MSITENAHTSVLLPASQVTLFSKDDEVIEALQALSADWRFARVVIDVQQGDVDTANKYYESHDSPTLLIIQTDETGAAFTDKLEKLGEYCDEGTSAVVIGPVNDVNLYRQLVGLGVSDYMVKPLPADVFADEVAAILIQQAGAGDSRLIAMMGAKGGVGTTVMTEALAFKLSQDLGQKTFVLDAAGGWSTLNVGLNFQPSTTLPEAARAVDEENEDSLTRMIHKAGERLFVLSSGGDVMLDHAVDPAAYEKMLDYFMGLYPVVVLDLSGAPSAIKQIVLKRAHRTFLFTTPTLPSLRATRTLMQEIKSLRGNKSTDTDIILNKIGLAPKFEVSKKQAEDALENKISGFIPFDPSLFIQCESEAKSLDRQKGGEKVMNQIVPLLQDALGLKDDDKDKTETAKGLGGLFSKMKSSS
jgi:pilus assembly protein CpaE